MRNTKRVWEDGRPVFERLPVNGYQDNLVADALTSWVDSKLSETKALMEAWHLEVSPDTCKDSSLDYLGYLVGFSGRFWDPNWEPEIKRELIRRSHSYLWPYRGTMQAIRVVLAIHNIDHDVWQQGLAVMPFKMPQVFGGQGLRFFVRLSIENVRGESNWKEAERTLYNFAPAVCQTKVTYKRFYLGFSRIGEPMFSK